MCLLEQAAFALQEGAGRELVKWRTASAHGSNLHGAVSIILDGLDFNLSATHGDGSLGSLDERL
jgi:hypothetical protein